MKVVYNRSFGGFSLSGIAIDLGCAKSGDPNWGGPEFGASGIDRSDPILVEVVEELGEAANGDFAMLGVADIPSGAKWRIDEYDGSESVMTVDDYDWKIAE